MINQYDLELNDQGLPCLVKEKSFSYENEHIRCVDEIYDLMRDAFRLDRKAEERVYMVACNTQGRILGVFEDTKGTVNLAMFSTRELLLRAFLVGAVSIFLVHNHPSGDLSPSDDDIRSTQNFKEAAKICGLQLLDHLVISNQGYTSMRDVGII